MQIAQVLSGYSLGEADLLRRAMGKKIKKEMDQQKSRFVEGAVDNGVDRERAEYIFELVARFAGYGFNKSHAAAYALLAYQTGYLKANHPVEFLAASMTLDMGNTDKLGIFVQEARHCSIEILPPSISHSEAEFSSDGKSIRYALAALKNMGRQAADSIVAERKENGPYSSLGDFAQRVDASALNKRCLETLAASGAFDVAHRNRAALFASPDRLLQAANLNADKSQDDLFNGDQEACEPVLRPTDPWSAVEQLDREFEAVGLYLSGHPLDQYEAALQQNNIVSWLDFVTKARKGAHRGKLAGSVVRRQERRARNGGKFAFIQFSDRTGQFEAIVFSDILSEYGEVLVPGATVMVELEAEPEPDGDSVRARIRTVLGPLDAHSVDQPSGIRVVLDDDASIASVAEKLTNGGSGEVRLVLRLADIGRQVELAVPDIFDPSPSEMGALAVVEGVEKVEPLYAGKVSA